MNEAAEDIDALVQDPPKSQRRVTRHLHKQRERARTKPGLRQLYRSFIFALGLLFIGIGIGLSPLPGPLTIPPVLLGVWIWSTEFAWADRFFDSVKEKADLAWEQAKLHPVSSAVFSAVGILGAVVALWAVKHFGLMQKLVELSPFG